MHYQPTYESVTEHPVPAWFDDAKLGIFIHWGLYSVPAWAPNFGELHEVIASGNWREWFAHNPYAEWYANTYRIAGSPTQQHHFTTYGHAFSYTDFAPMFNEAVEHWDPTSWASLFRQVGARYVVLTTKHHDGFLLWPSQTLNPFHTGYFSQRDLCGELAQAVRTEGMTMAYYYSGGVDWTFDPQVVQSVQDLRAATPQRPEYVAYANAHWRELIDRYKTAILWNDIAYPKHTDTNELFAYYYNRIPDGVINNRFGQYFDAQGQNQTVPVHHDFTTPEYQQYDSIQTHKWESCRGIGASFGYNQQEGPEQYLTTDALIHSFVDIVSKNGNLLLNVGPTATGEIPALQQERLQALGQWLDINGEAIFGSRPWTVAEGTTDSGVPIRYTTKEDVLYVILLNSLTDVTFRIPNLQGPLSLDVSVQGRDDIGIELIGNDQGLAFRTTAPLTDAIAHTLRLTPRSSLQTNIEPA